MSDLESLERRVETLEQRQNDLAARMTEMGLDPTKNIPRPRSPNTARVFWGIFIVLIGFLWLGQTYGIEWLESVKFWPIALIVFGVYMMVAGRRR